MDVARIVNRLTRGLQRRVMGMIGRAVLTAIDDSTKAQIVQVRISADDVREDVERFGEYGFTSVPPKDVEAIIVFVGGNSGHGVVVATESRAHRPTGLAEGESALYTMQDGLRVWCKADGTVEVGTSPTDFVALASLVNDEFTRVKGDIQGIVDAITNGVPVAQDGGAALQASIVLGLVGIPSNTAAVDATEVKAK